MGRGRPNGAIERTLTGLATVAAAAALAGLAPGCGPASQPGTSAVELIVDRLEAAPGDSTAFATVLHSDIGQGAEADQGRVVLRVRPRDPGPAAAPTAPSPMHAVTITRYRVAFRRSDRRGVEGRDVPHAFEGAVTVAVDDTATPLVFTLVRPQAKLEPPLAALAGGGGPVVLSTQADVAFYGQDGRGRDVAASASITVHFADRGGSQGT